MPRSKLNVCKTNLEFEEAYNKMLGLKIIYNDGESNGEIEFEDNNNHKGIFYRIVSKYSLGSKLIDFMYDSVTSELLTKFWLVGWLNKDILCLTIRLPVEYVGDYLKIVDKYEELFNRTDEIFKNINGHDSINKINLLHTFYPDIDMADDSQLLFGLRKQCIFDYWKYAVVNSAIKSYAEINFILNLTRLTQDKNAK